MDVTRRNLIQILGIAPAAAAALTQAEHTHAAPPAPAKKAYQRKVFDDRQWRSVQVLCDLIIPADEHSGSATAAGVPEFIDDWLDFRAREYGNEDLSAGILGGLAWLDLEATRHEESLSKVPISVTALTQEAMDVRGIKDILDVARFTPGINIDNSGTNNIAIRGIASTGGAGTAGIYLDDTPIQIRALAFNPDDALPQSFDLDRVEVLRGPQGTLFGAGSEGGTVRYITTQPSLTQTSIYSRNEISNTQGGVPSYELGVAAGTPLIDGTLGVRVSAWYRYDGGYINRIDPVSLA